MRRTPDAFSQWPEHHHHIETRPAVLLKTFDDPDETNELPGGRARAEAVILPAGRFVRATTQPGFGWSTDVQPLMGGDACTMAHVGLLLEGHYHFEFKDGTSLDVDPGSLFQIGAGHPHDEWVVGDGHCRTIDFYFQNT